MGKTTKPGLDEDDIDLERCTAAAGRLGAARGSKARTMAESELAQWDLEIEEKYKREVADTNRAGQRKRGRGHIGCPWAFLVDVCRLTEGRTAMLMALFVYRRTKVEKSRTVKLPADDLADMGIDRRRKNKALAKLEIAGLIKIERMAVGQSADVTLTWKPN